MRFTITRTSTFWKNDVEPCPEAFRSDDNNTWHVDVVDTLDDLVAFIDRNGRVIVDAWPDELPSIEIYDDYRE